MHKWIVRNSPLFISTLLIVALLALNSRGISVQSISGLAVATTGSSWVSLKDASVGTPITSGLASVGPFWYNGTNFDVARGDATNGAYVQVKAAVSPTPQSAVGNGQLGLSGSATAFPSNSVKQFCIEALSTNPNKIYLGTSTVTTSGSTGGLELTPGSSRCYTLNNTNLVYAISTATGNTASFDWIN